MARFLIVAALLFARRVQHLTTVTRVGPTPRRELHLHLPHLPQLHWPAAGGHAAAAHPAAPGQAQITSVIDPDHESAIYAVSGELFFASTSDLADHFQYAEDPEHVIIDLTAAHIWDASSVAVLDRVIERYERRGKTVELVGLNDVTGQLHDRLSGHLAASH